MLGLGLATSKGGFVDALAEVTNTKSILFDGTNDFIQFGDSDVVTDNFTISGWVKPTDASDFGIIMSKYDDNTTYKSDRVFRIVISGSVCICTIKTSSGNNLATSTTTTTLSDGEWFHFSFTNDGSNLKGYINGVLEDTDSTASGSLNSSNQNFLIGAQYVNTVVDNEFGGNIDEVGIWNEALTASEVAQIYNGSKANFDLSQNGGGYTSASNLQAWWRMGDGTLDDFPLIGDQTNTTLGAELINTNVTSNLSYWQSGGNDGITIVDNTVRIENDSNSLIRLKSTTTGSQLGALSENLEVGQAYKLQADIKVNIDAGASMSWFVSTLGQFLMTDTEETVDFSTFTLYFTANSATALQLKTSGMASGEITFIKNISLKKVINGGIMTNMTSGAIETDTP